MHDLERTVKSVDDVVDESDLTAENITFEALEEVGFWP